MRRMISSLVCFASLFACGDDGAPPLVGTDTASDATAPDTLPQDTTASDTAVPDTQGADTGGTPDTAQVDTSIEDILADTSPDVATDTEAPDTSGPTDASTGNASAQIQALIDAANQNPGPVAVDVIIQGATVTIAKPAIEAEKQGFFLQADKAGPAIFVVNEAGPNPARGDLITLRATQVATLNGAVQVTAFDALSRGTGGNALALLQDVDAVDLVAAFDSLQSEAIALDFEVIGDFGAAGAGFKSAQIVTAGNQVATDALKVRLPTPLVTSLALSAGCVGTLKYGVFWRFKGSAGFAQSQPSVFDPSDLEIVCEGPELKSAAAASPTQVLLNFDKPVEASSVNANGNQFTIAGLTVSAAVVEGRTVRLTTSAQTPDNTYTVRVAATVVDAAGRPAFAPAGQDTFSGFAGLTKLLINEVDYDQQGDDLAEFVELYNPNAGPVDLSGYVLVLVNGNTPAAPALYQSPAGGIALSGSIPANGYAVVSNAGVVVPQGVIQIVAFAANGTLQNGGNDGLQLRTAAGVVVDALLYETQATVDAALLGFGEGTPFSGSDSGSGLQSVARCPNGTDSDDNASDFEISVTPSAGASNVCP